MPPVVVSNDGRQGGEGVIVVPAPPAIAAAGKWGRNSPSSTGIRAITPIPARTVDSPQRAGSGSCCRCSAWVS